MQVDDQNRRESYDNYYALEMQLYFCSCAIWLKMKIIYIEAF